MKPFGIWLVLACIIFGGISGGYHVYLNENPRKILVAVDTSYPMNSVWHKVKPFLEKLGNQRYTEFALVTEKNRIHGWTSSLTTGKLSPYAPRDFSGFENSDKYKEVKEADRVILLTNAPSSETESLAGWEIVNLNK